VTSEALAAAELLTVMSERLAQAVADQVLEDAAASLVLRGYVEANREELRNVCLLAALDTQRRLADAVPTDEAAQALFAAVVLAAVRT
jgi:hypothetical protein